MALLAPAWVKFPTLQTLDKYGLDIYLWAALGQEQGWVCAICGKRPARGVFAIDHEHVPGFSKMSEEQKRKHVRGLLCVMPCNRYLVAKNSLQTAAAVVAYLDRHNKRLNPCATEER